MPPKRQSAGQADLQSQSARISQELTSLRSQLRNFHRRAAYAHRIPKLVETAAKVHWCRFQRRDLLVKFMRFKTGMNSKDLSSWEEAVCSWFATASPEQRAVMTAADSLPSLRRAAAEIQRYCNEQCLHEWVVNLNVDVGVSPTTGTLLNELDKRGMVGLSNKYAGQKRKYRGSLQFLRRWRRRWSVRLGKFDTLDFEEPANLRIKASATHSTVSAVYHGADRVEADHW